MAFVPEETVWYLAQLIVEITVEGDLRNVVHVNYMLINASSPEEAYMKSLNLGEEHESTYLNPSGKIVRCSFKGLKNLTVIYDRLEDGSEIFYEELVAVDKKQMSQLIREKTSLGAFRPITKSSGPDYASDEIQREAMNIVKHRKS